MNIPYQRFRFTVEAQDTVLLPGYAGSTFRGAFGTVFRRIVCALRQKECAVCMLNSTCAYAYIFETAPQGGARFLNTGKYSKIPHPFIIEPPSSTGQPIRSGTCIEFHLVLVGRALHYLPYFVCTFDEIGKSGIGKGRGGYTLLSVESTEGNIYSRESKTVSPCSACTLVIPDRIDLKDEPAMRVRLTFQTPLRIQHERKLATTMPFGLLVRNILRRVGLLYYHHCGGGEPTWNVPEIIAAAEAVAMEHNTLTWYDWERYSSRQRTLMKLGGLVGDITYAGLVGSLLPLLQAAEVLHVGKGTSFGLGKFTVQHA